MIRDVLNSCYFVHFCLLVRAIYLLSQECISTQDIIVAESCIQEFIKNFADFYSARHMTMNIHQLLHLPQAVRSAGPLFVNNCFVFEDLNGFIVSHIHGTKEQTPKLFKLSASFKLSQLCMKGLQYMILKSCHSLKT